LTRSGVLGEFSVHSFADLGINAYLMLFMFLFTLLSFGLFLFRLSGIVQAETTKDLLSVEFFIFLAITFLSVSAFLVLMGTSAPLITKLFGQASNVGVAYYVNTQLPLGIILALLLGFAPFLGWRGSKLNDLFQAFLPTLIMAIFLTILAFVLKVTFSLYLILMFVSFLAVMGNLTILIKRSKAGWKSLGGFVTHVGVGLMLVGIITSSGYSRSVKLNLPENEAKDAFGYQFTYLGTEGDTLNQKSALEVKVGKGENSFLAEPKLYFSEYNQAYMRTPYIRITPLYDLYLAPLENQTGEGTGENKFLLKKGESKEVGGYNIRFVGFDMSSHGMEGGMRVGAALEITYEDEKQTFTPAIVMGGTEAEDSLRVVMLPGGNDHLILERINADDKSVALDLILTNPEAGKNLLVLEVSRKPLINVLWLGTILIMAGLVIATYRRTKESKYGQK
jgi:cytochrome c-type biogenesis protein CcmF